MPGEKPRNPDYERHVDAAIETMMPVCKPRFPSLQFEQETTARIAQQRRPCIVCHRKRSTHPNMMEAREQFIAYEICPACLLTDRGKG